MRHIVVEDLRKTYRIAERDPGMVGALRGLVRRRHREIQALDGISFSLDAGELVGYIGPNGAGKSTTVKILSGILVPDSGRCEILGRTPWRQRREHVQNIGVVFGQRTQLWWDLPVVESFELLRDIYRVPQAEYAQRRDEVIALLTLEPLLDTPVRQLSLGQRMRCDLAAALLHSPSLLFLDEPTIGLDAVAKLAVRDFIQRLNRERGVTVILTTHDLDDIEALCSRVMVIGSGSIVFDGTVQGLRDHGASERRLTIDLADDDSTIDDPAATVVSHEGRRVQLRYNPEETSTPELIARIVAKHAVRDLYVESPPIEEIIARLYEQDFA